MLTTKVVVWFEIGPRAWYAKIDSFFMTLGFKHCGPNHIFYVLHVTHGDTLIVVVYVDDFVITGNNLDIILELKRQIPATFEMTDFGILHYFLGLKVFPCLMAFLSLSLCMI